MNDPRSIITKNDMGSVLVELHGKHFTTAELYRLTEEMIELCEDDSIVTCTRQRN